MTKYIIISAVIVCICIFLIRRYRKYKRKQKHERQQELKAALNATETKKKELFSFISLNREKFYKSEDLIEIGKCEACFKEVNEKITELHVNFNEKRNSQEIEKVIEKAKQKAGFYIDPFGMQEETARVFMKMRLNVDVLRARLEIFHLGLKVRSIWSSYIFGHILPEFKTEKNLVEKCEAFLKEELKFYIMANKFNVLERIDARLIITEAILNSIKSDEISLLLPQFTPFFEAA